MDDGRWWVALGVLGIGAGSAVAGSRGVVRRGHLRVPPKAERIDALVASLVAHEPWPSLAWKSVFDDTVGTIRSPNALLRIATAMLPHPNASDRALFDEIAVFGRGWHPGDPFRPGPGLCRKLDRRLAAGPERVETAFRKLLALLDDEGLATVEGFHQWPWGPPRDGSAGVIRRGRSIEDPSQAAAVRELEDLHLFFGEDRRSPRLVMHGTAVNGWLWSSDQKIAATPAATTARVLFAGCLSPWVRVDPPQPAGGACVVRIVAGPVAPGEGRQYVVHFKSGIKADFYMWNPSSQMPVAERAFRAFAAALNVPFEEVH